ncbi:archaetidylserine decarboxylase [Heliorestis convoluta]|uniref:Phosphatidylserine decarboxylase proenzyme n=1 Tax=Heliorestis convoluta TaxID=356322 RepID=A0A5Q2N2E9_9FIRM|nr:archaetidylserine decarboxylase [Heliorestis convoluta]QGG46510.1 phosphatidylserine decarboxylase [Heliorestis convoluta]
MRHLWLTLFNILPNKWLSRQAGHWASASWSRSFIPLFIRRFNVDLEEAEKPWQDYNSLADFFARKLKPGLRPVCDDETMIVSPVDGVISQIGRIKEGKLIQAKGIDYSLEQLLGDPQKVRQFMGGHFVTIYLSPRDYHRIHCPYTGEVQGYAYWPGKLYPVNQKGVQNVPGLFARNERLITYMNTAIGAMAVIKVGAVIVGGIKVGYAPITSNQGAKAQAVEMTESPTLQKGDELGYFQFGSTVILLFEPHRVEWLQSLCSGTSVRMGEKIAKIRS